MVTKNGKKEFKRLFSLARKADERRIKKSDNSILPGSNITDLNDVETKILSQRCSKSRSTDV